MPSPHGHSTTYQPKIRLSVIQAIVVLKRVAEPFPEIVEVDGRSYRIEELADDPIVLDEFWQARLQSSTLLRLVCRLPSKLRYEIWRMSRNIEVALTVRSQQQIDQRHFPYPKVHCSRSLRPHEAEAKRTIQAHGETLMRIWQRTRPDDQRLDAPFLKPFGIGLAASLLISRCVKLNSAMQNG
jgi:hypothetical protein